MKFIRFFFLLAILSFFITGVFSSCSANKGLRSPQSSARLSPVSPKDSPPPKQYIIRNKRMNILGSERPDL